MNAMLQGMMRGCAALLLMVLLAGCRPITAAGDAQPLAVAEQGQQGDGQQGDGQQGDGKQGDGQQGDGQQGDGQQGDGQQGDGQQGGGQQGGGQQVVPAVTWDAAPACENDPHDLAAWRAEFAAYAPETPAGLRLEMLLAQMRRSTQALPPYAVADMADLLAAEPGDADREEAGEQMLAVLWLNLMDERLNRATALASAELAADAAAPQSVGEMSDQLVAAAVESAEWSALMELAAAVTQGEQLGAQVCAQVIYRSGADLHTVQWNEEGAAALVQTLDAPLGYTTFSPDYTRLVVQTSRGDTAGGPLYLYDVAAEQTVNLNEASGLPTYTGVSALKVVGWHPNNQSLLLANEDDEVILWLDLTDDSYAPVTLEIDHSSMSPPRSFLLAPNGSGFTFFTSDRATKATNLFWHDLTADSTRLLLTLPAEAGKLEGLQIAPDGKQALFVLHIGSRSEGRSEELTLINLADGSSEVVLEGALGPLQPVWSPDSTQLAFVRRNLDQPLKAGPHATLPLGDLWTLTIASGELQQLTFTQALDRAPVWSSSGDLLAFVTAGNELGLVRTGQPDLVWRVESLLEQPKFTHIGFLP